MVSTTHAKNIQQQDMKTHIDACTARYYTTSIKQYSQRGIRSRTPQRAMIQQIIDVEEEEEFNASKGQEETEQEEN